MEIVGLPPSGGIVVPSYPMKASPTYFSRESIERVAESFAQKINYAPGKPLEPIVKRLGGEISVQHSPNDGELKVGKGGSFEIFLSPYTGRSRDRFTVAHELGHFVLHAQLGKKEISIARSGSNKLEAEANLFAAAFLMPEKEFRSVVSALRADGAVAAHFDVSTDAVRVRKQVLGIKTS